MTTMTVMGKQPCLAKTLAVAIVISGVWLLRLAVLAVATATTTATTTPRPTTVCLNDNVNVSMTMIGLNHQQASLELPSSSSDNNVSDSNNTDPYSYVPSRTIHSRISSTGILLPIRVSSLAIRGPPTPSTRTLRYSPAPSPLSVALESSSTLLQAASTKHSSPAIAISTTPLATSSSSWMATLALPLLQSVLMEVGWAIVFQSVLWGIPVLWRTSHKWISLLLHPTSSRSRSFKTGRRWLSSALLTLSKSKTRSSKWLSLTSSTRRGSTTLRVSSSSPKRFLEQARRIVVHLYRKRSRYSIASELTNLIPPTPSSSSSSDVVESSSTNN